MALQDFDCDLHYSLFLLLASSVHDHSGDIHYYLFIQLVPHPTLAFIMSETRYLVEVSSNCGALLRTNTVHRRCAYRGWVGRDLSCCVCVCLPSRIWLC